MTLTLHSPNFTKVRIISFVMTNMSLVNIKITDIFVPKKMRKQRCNQDLLIKIARRVKQLRTEKNISQDIFYFDTDIHIARIEVGKINITVSTLHDICIYFNISFVDFFKELEQIQ